MGDVGYLALMVAFIVLAIAFAVGCDKIVGPDEAALSDAERERPTRPRTVTAAGQGGDCAVSTFWRSAHCCWTTTWRRCTPTRRHPVTIVHTLVGGVFS